MSIPTGTPTMNSYWPDLVVNSTETVDGAQSYKITDVQKYGTPWPQGGLRLTTVYTPTQGIYATNVYVHSWHNWFGTVCGVVPVYATGLNSKRSDGTQYPGDIIWALQFNDNTCTGAVLLGAYDYSVDKIWTLSMTVTTGIWYPVRIIWDLKPNVGDTETFTVTVGTTTDVLTRTISSITYRTYGVQDIREGNYGESSSGTHGVLSFDNAFMIENSVLTPTPTPTVTPTATFPPGTPTRTPTPTPTSAPGIWLIGICPQPLTDVNLDGVTDSRDRTITLYNQDAGFEPVGWQVIIAPQAAAPDVRTICNQVVPQYAYRFPRWTRLFAQTRKLIYGSDLRDMYGDVLEIPTHDGVVAICQPGGAVSDFYWYTDAGPGKCYLRDGGGDPWRIS
jgi:hypothetical protein